MSIRWLPREQGLAVICHGTAISADVSNCTLGDNGKPAKFVSGVILATNVRDWIKKNLGWGRGLRKDRKRCDLCPGHLTIEQQLFEQEKAAREAEKKRRDELKKAKAAAGPKKPRKKKGDAAPSSPSPSLSADSAPAPAPF